MGGNPCRFKALMNGESIESEIKNLCYHIQEEGVVVDDKSLYYIVEHLNRAEDLVFKAKRIFLESQGFKGEESQGGWPNSLVFRK